MRFGWRGSSHNLLSLNFFLRGGRVDLTYNKSLQSCARQICGSETKRAVKLFLCEFCECHCTTLSCPDQCDNTRVQIRKHRPILPPQHLGLRIKMKHGQLGESILTLLSVHFLFLLSPAGACSSCVWAGGEFHPGQEPILPGWKKNSQDYTIFIFFFFLLQFGW